MKHRFYSIILVYWWAICRLSYAWGVRSCQIPISLYKNLNKTTLRKKAKRGEN